MGWNQQSTWNGAGWTGASGYQIGFAGDYPEIGPDGFVTDSIHGTDSDPNGPNFSAQEGPEQSTPVVWQDDTQFTQYQGADGWTLDNLDLPDPSENPGTVGHGSSMGPATGHGIDRGHAQDVYQLSPPAGHGRNFYGPKLFSRDLDAWLTSSAPAPQEAAYPAQAREDTSAWPEPFVAASVAHMPPVMVPDEQIDMRWMTEDDRPTYRMLAVPARNVQVAGNQFTPSVPSNTELYNVNVLPEMPRTPDDPWPSQEIAAAQMDTGENDVFNGFGVM